ncbi:helix-turn-helix transcriptional regulator [Agromyces subbeticus]|uniref:helix-turn-helix transcriptional regulator n=1 Tax=Agromyces subbeticus TaxID=293890 RepID=UPI00047EA073|nr:helix-turn-helix domain-containing protein [Agromyces subbeticus]
MSSNTAAPSMNLMSITELSNYLQVPVTTIYDWRAAKKKKGPPAIKLGKHLRWRREAVDAWLELQTEAE